MRAARAVALSVALLVTASTALAQGLSNAEQDFLAAQFPGSEAIADAVGKLGGSSAGLLKASSRIAAEKSCAMDREFVALGGALRSASEALKRLEPMLLGTAQPYLQRRQAYRQALDSLAAAGAKLASLDPIGAAGPPADAGGQVRGAGQSLLGLDEKSGIGLHLMVAGEAIETFRLATLQFDKAGCAQSARFLGEMVGLTRSSLGFSGANVWRAAAGKLLALAVGGLSHQVRASPLDGLKGVLDLYAKSLEQMALDLRRQAEIARGMQGTGALAGAAAKYRAVAPVLANNAAPFPPVAARVREARDAVSGTAASPPGRAAAMRSAGAILEKHGNSFALVGAGEALRRAGELLGAGDDQGAEKVLWQAALKITNAESAVLVLETP